MPNQIVNFDRLKQINLSAVYRLIDQEGPISRVQLAQKSQLAPASITKITRQLLQAGTIKEVSAQQSTGGRRAISLTTSGDFQFISARIGRGDLKVAIYNLAGQQLELQTYPLIASNQSEFLERLCTLLQQFHTQYQQQKHPILALAVTLPGLIESGSGIARYIPYYRLTDCPIGQTLEQAFQLPVYVGNDTRATTLAEYYFGQSQDSTDSVFISIHQGTSAGILVNGDIFIYPQRDLGEIGHIQLDPLGEPCQCGNIGCLETICSNPAILNFAKTHAAQHTTLFQVNDSVQQLYRLAANGDVFCELVVKRAALALGQVIAIVVNLFNPQKILLAGEIIQAGDIFWKPIQQCLEHQTLPTFRNQTQIQAAYFQAESAIGGHALIKRAMLNGELLLKLIK
ncbi:ROK family protein [Celerinatantimonas sp. YJH-8]|uniref:ROK family protein n=1 Tax=Celerinatantimonas sp. YJH-8 TaxID=3228714 RepID=UPI0038CB40F6